MLSMLKPTPADDTAAEWYAAATAAAADDDDWDDVCDDVIAKLLDSRNWARLCITTDLIIYWMFF